MKEISPRLEDELRHEWNTCAELLTSEDVSSTLEEVKRIKVEDLKEATHYHLHREVTVAAITAACGELVLLHAGAIANDKGDVIALVAPSGTGKTTAVRHLGIDFSYVSDETLACTPDGEVFPYPKPLSIGSRKDGEKKTGLAPSDAGLKELPKRDGKPLPLHLAGVVILERDPDFEGAPQLQSLGVLEGLARIIQETSSALLLDDPLHTYAKLCARSGGPWLLRYREITDCSEIIANLFEHVDQVPETKWECLGPGTIKHTKTSDLPTDIYAERVLQRNAATNLVCHFKRTDWVDALADDEGQILLSLAPLTILLTPIAAYLWKQLHTPQTGWQLLAATTAEFGDHPEAESIVRQMLGVLLSRGAVTIR